MKKFIEPFGKHRLLPEEVQDILKDAAKECKNLRTLAEREDVLNRAIRIAHERCPKSFRDERNPFDTLSHFIMGWSE